MKKYRPKFNYTAPMIKFFEICGQYEPQTTRYFDALIEGAKLFVDIGAFNGFYCKRAFKAKVKMIDAYEPNNQKRKGLEKLGIITHLRPYVILDYDGTTKFIEGRQPELSSAVIKTYGKTTEKFCYKLDTLYPNQRIDVLKIDAEGAEQLIIKGASKLLAEDRIGSMILEYRPQYQDMIQSLNFNNKIILNDKPFGLVPNHFGMSNLILTNVEI